MQTYSIKIQNLTREFKTYKKPEGLKNSLKGVFNREYINKLALKPTSLNIEAGQIIGLIGANGAGKTTLLKILSGLIAPSSGEVSVLGFDPWKKDKDFLKQISILLGQKNQLWWDLAPADSFAMLAKIYDLEETESKKHYLKLAEILSCKDQLHTQLRRLSLGERMKMELIGCLLHQPKVLFLDEPTIGLDIVAQNAIRKFLKEYSAEFKPTIILTSHYMDDISELADKLLLISKGQIVYSGTVNDFSKQTHLEKKLFITFKKATEKDFTLLEHSISKNTQEFSIDFKSENIGEILSIAALHGEIKDLKIEEPDFEDVIHQFLQKN